MSALDDFRVKLENFDRSFVSIERGHKELLASRDRFSERLFSIDVPEANLAKNNPLTEGARKVRLAIGACVDDAHEAWDAAGEMRSLSENFKDRIVFLIHGKVNAGKSSLCNYLASTFPANQVKFFRVQDGKTVRLPDSQFAEGATETTAQLQGIHLADRFTILDTPGLHSTTRENAALTKRFMESADAVMWLTPSTAPGQVDELENLTAEIEKRIPILPVICRSDVYVEDENEAGQIERVLQNKDPKRRQNQEADVFSRARDAVAHQSIKHAGAGGSGEFNSADATKDSSFPDCDLVIRPISISVHAFQASAGTDVDLEESGLGEFFRNASKLVDEAARKKPHKLQRQVLSHVDHDLLRPLRERLEPMLAELKSDISRQVSEFEQMQGADSPAAVRITRELNDYIEEWAEELSVKKDRSELVRRMNEFITRRVNDELRKSVGRFEANVAEAIRQVKPDDVGAFEDMTIEYESVSGTRGAAASAAAGATGGAALGSMAGPLGMAFGAVLGGWLGSKAGSAAFIETETLEKTVGVDSTEVITTALTQGRKQLVANLERAFEPWRKALEEMKVYAETVEKELHGFEADLESARAKLETRAGGA